MYKKFELLTNKNIEYINNLIEQRLKTYQYDGEYNEIEIELRGFCNALLQMKIIHGNEHTAILWHYAKGEKIERL